MPVLRKLPSCEGCTLLKQPGPVFGEGDPVNAKIIYIPQNPGVQETSTLPMRPLQGASGNLFNYQCGQAGLRREDIYITNVVKCLTPGNREPTSLEISKCKPIIDAELARCKADTVVLSGGVAFNAFIGGKSSLRPDYLPKVGKGNHAKPATSFTRMGCVEIFGGRKWIGTVHPAYFLRNPELSENGVLHLKKAQAIAGITLPKLSIRKHVTTQEVLEFVDRTILGTREFADDVETVGLEEVDEDDYVGGDWLMTMCGVANSPWEALVLDPKQVPLLQPIFTDPTIWRYEQNGEYDNYFLERYIPTQLMANRKFDTMQGTHWLRSHAPKKLKPYILSTYTWLPYYNRDLGKLDERFYNGLDLVTTFQAAKEMRRQLKNEQLEEVFFALGQPILPILEEWRRIGLKVDVRKALLFRRLIEEKIKRANGLITQIIGPLINPDSPKQVAELLYSRYGLPKQFNRKQGKEVLTTDYEARKRLRLWIEASPDRISTYKAAHTFLNLSDFLNGEQMKLQYIGRIAPDGRIHPNYKAHGQRVFRLGSTPSVVNIPVYDISAWGGARRDDNDDSVNPIEDKEDERALSPAKGQPSLGSLRSLIIPDHPEDLLLTCDFEQMQLWILAAQFKVKWLLDIFESGEYFYGVVFEKLYNEPFFQAGKPRTKKYKLPISEQRIRRVKAVPLGFVFNRTGEAVAKEYGWPAEEGRQYRRWFMGECKELEPAYAKVEYTVRQTKRYRHVFGQICHFPNLHIPAAINSCAQSNEAMIMRETLIFINQEYVRRGWKPAHIGSPPYPRMTRLMLSVHDAKTTNVNMERGPQHMVEVYEEVVKPILERPIPQLGGFRFRHSAEVSTMWDWQVTNYSDWKATTFK